jgi:hypothetical protein
MVSTTTGARVLVAGSVLALGVVLTLHFLFKKKKGIGWLSQWNEFIASVLNTFCQIDANDDGLVDLKKLNCP